MKQKTNVAVKAFTFAVVAMVSSCTKSPSLVSEDTLELSIPFNGSVYQGKLDLPHSKTIKSGRFNYEMQDIEYVSCSDNVDILNVEQKPITHSQEVTPQSDFTITRKNKREVKLTFKLKYLCKNCLDA